MYDIFSYLTFFDGVGIVGAAGYLLSYVLAAFDKLPSQSPNYYVLKLFSASCVGFSLLEDFNIASALIQVAFVFLSLIGIARHIYARVPALDMDFDEEYPAQFKRIDASNENSAVAIDPTPEAQPLV
jgi:hypothetical protein